MVMQFVVVAHRLGEPSSEDVKFWTAKEGEAVAMADRFSDLLTPKGGTRVRRDGQAIPGGTGDVVDNLDSLHLVEPGHLVAIVTVTKIAS